MKRRIHLVLPLFLVVGLGSAGATPSVQHATPSVQRASSADELVDQLAGLIDFARRNIDQDPRSATFSEGERMAALLESLMLYGIRFSSTAELRASMSSRTMAQHLLTTAPIRSLPMLKASISELASTLRPVLDEGHATSGRAETKAPGLFVGHGD